MRIFLVLAAALGGLAFWRRKTLKDDVTRATDAGKDAAAKVGDRMNRGSADADADDTSSGDEAADDQTAGDDSADEAADAAAD